MNCNKVLILSGFTKCSATNIGHVLSAYLLSAYKKKKKSMLRSKLFQSASYAYMKDVWI